MRASEQKFAGQVEGFLGVGENCTPEFAIKYGDVLPSFFLFLNYTYCGKVLLKKKKKGGKAAINLTGKCSGLS